MLDKEEDWIGMNLIMCSKITIRFFPFGRSIRSIDCENSDSNSIHSSIYVNQIYINFESLKVSDLIDSLSVVFFFPLNSKSWFQGITIQEQINLWRIYEYEEWFLHIHWEIQMLLNACLVSGSFFLALVVSSVWVEEVKLRYVMKWKKMNRYFCFYEG